jgi:acetyl esterase/lipase
MILGLDTVDETRALNTEIERQQSDMPPRETVDPVELRAQRKNGMSVLPAPELLPDARWLEIPSRGGPLRVRVIAPTGDAKGAYLHFHGGGWVIGAPDEQDLGLQAIAETAGLCAVSVEYRLAPEHPYPAAQDDCEDAALWLLEHGPAELGVPARYAVGGESAGGHLSAATLLRLRDRHGISGAFAAANLVFGVFDLSGTPSRRHFGDRQLVLTDSTMSWFGRSYVPGYDTTALRDPDISPLYADLRDMPPALFTVGTADALLDDSLFMAARWDAAGNRADLRVYAEGCHGFTAFPLAIAQDANAAQLAFLRDAVAQ